MVMAMVVVVVIVMVWVMVMFDYQLVQRTWYTKQKDTKPSTRF